MQCRVCRRFHCDDAMDMSYVVPTDGKTLYDYFNDCTQLNATIEDELPKVLCMNCTEILQQAYSFRQEARRSDEELRKVFTLAKCEEDFNYNIAPNQTEVLEDIEASTYKLLHLSPKRETFVYYPEDPTALKDIETDKFDIPTVSAKNECTAYEAIDQPVVLENNDDAFTIDPLSAPGYSGYLKTEIKVEHSNDIPENYNDIPAEPKHHNKKKKRVSYASKPRTPYACELCTSKFQTKNKLKTHIFTMHKETIICPTCCKVFEVPAEMVMHKKLVHETDIDMDCPWCKESNILPKAALAKHLQKKHSGVYLKYFPRLRILERGEDDPYQCEQCKKFFSSIEELANHVQAHTVDCTLCSMSFKKTASYKIHLKRIHKQSWPNLKLLLIENDEMSTYVKCTLCEKLLKSQETLKKHMKSKHKESISSEIKSNNKEISTNNESGEQTHEADKEKSSTIAELYGLSEIDGDKLVECKTCHKEIPAKRIVDHEKRHIYQLNQQRKCICSFCSREFQNLSGVREHERKVHLRDKSERKECHICHKLIDPFYFNAHINNVHNTERSFPCDICGDFFKTPAQVTNHKLLHLNRKYPCTICNKGFIRQVDLKVHMRIHTGEEPYACHLCERRFKYKVQLNYHLQRHAGIKRKCNVCGKEFNHIKHLKNHSYKHTGMPYRCTVCKYACAQRDVQNGDVEESFNFLIPPQVQQVENVQAREFKNEAGVKDHERNMHMRDKSERKECPVCHKLIDPQSYNTHVKYVHTEERNFACDICGNLFKSPTLLGNHKKLHLNRKHPCTMCNKRFAKLSELKVHMRVHTGEEPFVCHICDRRFKVRVTLTYHLQKHAGIKRKCNVCGKEFNHIKELKKHSYKHTGMPYRCTVCKYACAQRDVWKRKRSFKCFQAREFKTQSGVRDHERNMHIRDKRERKECPICYKQLDPLSYNSHVKYVHSEERNFACDICGDLFKSSTLLGNHKRLHLNRKHPCTICDKRFIRPSDLKVHMRIHTGEEPYGCHICDRRFKLRVRLSYHLQQHAGIKRKCNICGKEFNHIKELKKHSYKHNGMPYRCTVCKYGCTERNVFKTHILRMHDMTMTDAEYRAMFKANTGRNPSVKTIDELQMEAQNMEVK